jgi:hypothetical protein
MDTTIEQRAMAAYKHVTSNILNQLEGSPLLTALNNAGVFDISDLISLTGQQVHSLSYDDNGTMRPVPVAPRNRVITFVAYINYRNNHGTPIGNDYLSVTGDQYDNFRCTEYLRSGNSEISYPDVNTRIMLKGINPSPKQAGIMDISEINNVDEDIGDNIEEDNVIGAELFEMESFEKVEESKKEGTPGRDATGPGNNKENVPRELEQLDLNEKSTLAVEEHDKNLGQYYTTIDKYEECKAKMIASELLPLVVMLPQPDPPPPEPPPRNNCKSVDHSLLERVS